MYFKTQCRLVRLRLDGNWFKRRLSDSAYWQLLEDLESVINDTFVIHAGYDFV